MLERQQAASAKGVKLRAPGTELKQAEKLLSEALALDPAFTEAQLHYGRVLGQLGKHQEAVVELRRVSGELRTVETGTRNATLAYYAALFLAGEEQALGHTDAAREAYRVASGLFPEAQSPLLGQTHLARRSGRRTDAQQAIDQVLHLRASEFERDDPWWDYYFAQGRNATQLLEQMYAPFRKGGLK
jgi:tetratricopeptide (TPR) repeat protein